MPNTDREHPIFVDKDLQQSQSEGRPAEAEKKLGMSMLMKIALGALLLSSLIISITCLMITNQRKRQIEEMKEEKAEYLELIKQLKYYVDANPDDQYIEDIARKLYDMYYPDEEVQYNDVND